MSKHKIISEFKERQRHLRVQFTKSDGYTYLQSLPMDVYGFTPALTKEQYPEYHRIKEEMNCLDIEYRQALCLLSKYKKDDLVIAGCQDSIEFGTIHDYNICIDDDHSILYYVKFDKSINAWAYGSSGGFFGENSCTLSFCEKDILMKAPFKEIQEMKEIPIQGLKVIYPELFVTRQYDEKMDKLKNLVTGFIGEVSK